jgi:hypothetical protein
MRSLIIIILSVVTAYVLIDTIGPAHQGNRYEGLAIAACAWLVFLMFDRVRAIEQRKRDRNPQKNSAATATQKRNGLNTMAGTMELSAPATPITLKQLVSDIPGSLTLALVLVFFDAVLSGGCLFSYIVCPVWFLVALVRAGFGSANRSVATARVLAPIITGVLVFGNFIIQSNFARGNAKRIVQACERYREDNGAYPEKLGNLVPRYLNSIPVAKYCLGANDFWYSNFEQTTTLMWMNAPPYGREYYNFQQRDWGDSGD